MQEQSHSAEVCTLCHLTGVAFQVRGGGGGGVLFVQFMSLLVFGNGKIFLSHGKADGRQDFPPEELIPREPESCSCLAGRRALVAPEPEAGQTGAVNAPAHPAFPQPPQRQVQAEARVFPATCHPSLTFSGTAGAVAHLCLWGPRAEQRGWSKAHTLWSGERPQLCPWESWLSRKD